MCSLNMAKKEVSTLTLKKLTRGVVFKMWSVGNSMLVMRREISEDFSSSHIRRLFL